MFLNSLVNINNKLLKKEKNLDCYKDNCLAARLEVVLGLIYWFSHFFTMRSSKKNRIFWKAAEDSFLILIHQVSNVCALINLKEHLDMKIGNQKKRPDQVDESSTNVKYIRITCDLYTATKKMLDCIGKIQNTLIFIKHIRNEKISLHQQISWAISVIQRNYTLSTNILLAYNFFA